jgi:hypothetical protein
MKEAHSGHPGRSIVVGLFLFLVPMAPKTERILCVDKYVTKSWFNNTGDAA